MEMFNESLSGGLEIRTVRGTLTSSEAEKLPLFVRGVDCRAPRTSVRRGRGPTGGSLGRGEMKVSAFFRSSRGCGRLRKDRYGSVMDDDYRVRVHRRSISSAIFGSSFRTLLTEMLSA